MKLFTRILTILLSGIAANVPTLTIAADSTKVFVSDSTQNNWTLLRGDTLYWAIAPTATWDDIQKVREALRTKGAELSVNHCRYDPLQLYLTTLVLYLHLSTGQNGTGEALRDEYTPIKGYSGFVATRTLGMGYAPPEPLRTRLEEQYQKALQLKQQNEVGHMEDRMVKKILKEGISLTYTSLPRRWMEGLQAESTLKKEGVGKSPENTFLITDLNQDAAFYLNTNPSSRQELSRLRFERIQKVTIGVDGQGKRYVMVYMPVGY